MNIKIYFAFTAERFLINVNYLEIFKINIIKVYGIFSTIGERNSGIALDKKLHTYQPHFSYLTTSPDILKHDNKFTH
jgi:hypothetical protein